jgi:hypothetical protein
MEPDNYPYAPNQGKDSPVASKKWRWQFSLRTIFILVAFFILALSHLKTTLDLRSTRRLLIQQTNEIDKLRGELGIFEIVDPSKAHLLFIRRDKPDSFRYRVYLPPRSREYEICIGTKHVSLSQLPDDMYQFQSLRDNALIRVDGTSFFVDVFLAKNADGEYHWHVRHPRGELFAPFKPFALEGQSHIVSGNSPGRVVLSNPNEPITLVNWLRDGDSPGAESDGLAVWIR